MTRLKCATGWRGLWDSAKTNVIDITAEPNHHYMHQATLNFVADTGASLRTIGNGPKAQQTWVTGEIEAVNTELQKAFPCDDVWGPAAVIDECRKMFARNNVGHCG